MYSRWGQIGRAFEKYVALEGERVFADLGAGPVPRLRGFKGADALLEYLHGRGGSDPERDRILAELIGAAKANDRAGRLAKALLWLAFWPALTALLSRTVPCSSEDEDEIAADLAEKFCVVVDRFDPTAVTKVAATLLWNTRRRFWDSLQARSEVQALEQPLEGEGERYLTVSSAADIVDALADLERELGDDAEIVVGCMVEGLTTREAAARCGVAREAIKKRLQRASARLRDGRMARLRDPDVPDRRETALIESKGMKQQGEVADGSREQRDEGTAPRTRRPRKDGASRDAHPGGRRTRLRGCGAPAAGDDGSGPMSGTSTGRTS